MRNLLVVAVLGIAIATAGCTGPLGGCITREPGLAHNVYVALNDSSPAARTQLVDACYKYLKNHPGVTSFAAGERVESHAREVNVRD
ncbi:MAG: hypothetical protein ACYTAS_18450 [Planctomycetota bacterium]